MSDLATGGDTDVDTELGFAAALAEAVGKELPEDYSPSGQSTDVRDGLTSDEESPAAREGQPKDPVTGRFVAKETEPSSPPQQEAAPAEGETPPEPVGLEKQLADSQELIGRQGKELGDLRAEMAALKSQVETPASPQYQAPNLDADSAEELVSQGGGVQEAVDAFFAGDARTYQLLIDTIAVDHPGVALRLHSDLQMAAYQANQENQPAPAPDPHLQAAVVKTQADNVRSALTRAAASDWDVIKPKFEEAVVLGGEDLAIKLASPQQSVVDEGVRLALILARGLSADAIKTSSVAVAEHQAASAALKQSTALGSGSLSPAPEGEAGGGKTMTPEEARQAFYAAIMGAETTNIADGLTQD